MWKGATDNDRWIRLLDRFWPSHHRREIDELAMVFGRLFGPDLLHRFDPLAHEFEAAFEGGAMVFDFLRIPATADSKQKAPTGDLIDRGDQLCCLYGVALHNEPHAGGKVQRPRHRCRSTEHDERIHDFVIGLGDFASTWKGCPAR